MGTCSIAPMTASRRITAWRAELNLFEQPIPRERPTPTRTAHSAGSAGQRGSSQCSGYLQAVVISQWASALPRGRFASPSISVRNPSRCAGVRVEKALPVAVAASVALQVAPAQAEEVAVDGAIDTIIAGVKVCVLFFK